MKVSCPSCGTNYNLDESRVPPGGAKLKCAKCRSTFPIRREGGAGAGASAASRPAQAAPRPGSAITATIKAATPAIPLPGVASLRADLNVATSPAIPLPGAPGPRPTAGGNGGSGFTLTAAVPRPGGIAAGPSDAQPTSAAMALPSTQESDLDDPGSLPWDAESTRVASIPMPAAALRPDTSSRSTPAIPLPGTGSGTPLGTPSSTGGFNAAVTTPGTPSLRSPVPSFPAPSSASPIPLPGSGPPPPLAAAPPPQVDPDDGLDFADADLVEPPPPSAAIPLPAGPGDESQATTGPHGFDFGDVDLGEPQPAVPPLSAAVPLPAGRDSNESTQLASGPHAMDFGEPPPAPAASGGVDFSLDFGEPAPAPEASGGVDFSLDFSEAPVPMPPPGSPLDSGELPSPAGAVAKQDSPFDFTGPDERTSTSVPLLGADDAGGQASLGAGLPDQAPAGPSPGGLLDFGELPSPASPSDLPGPAGAHAVDGDLGFDFSPPPPPAPEPPRSAGPAPFGETDPGAPRPAPFSVVDPLEFDPTSRASPVAPRDELEADLSAPIPPPASTGPADSLEMLSFIDDAARQQDSAAPPPRSSRVTRYHVRRRSGKVFGPFDEPVVMKMLQDGQLLGNEDVSPDGESWAPIATVPALGAVIQQMVAAPSRSLDLAASGQGDAARSGSQTSGVERIRQFYGGRMAAVAVVDRRQSSAALHRRIPLLVAAGLAALIVLVGGSFSFTRYGPFGVRKLLPARLSPASPLYAQYLEARKALLQDTFKSYREARDITTTVLAGKEYPEVRAVWCQAVFYLQRRYAAVTPQERMEAAAALQRVELLGMTNAEVAKAFAGRALAARSPAEALPILLEAKARAANESDRELDLLLAEAHASKGDPKAAEAVLQRLLEADRSSAKALHALGNLYQASNRADDAAKAYAAAVEADPDHAISAVELAAVDLLVRNSAADGLKALERALASESESLLGPAERSRARALRGLALAVQFKTNEAVEELEQALELDPDSVFAKATLARVLLSQREHKSALPLYKEVATREPTNFEYVEGYLLALIAAGNMSDALSQVSLANQRFPGNARIAFLYGRISDALDNASDAEGHYKRAIAADPGLYQANLALARFYLRFRRLADATPQLEEAERKAPGDPAVHAGLGLLDLEKGLLADARREFDAAIKVNPNLADAHLGLAKVELLESRFEAALREADQALALDEHLKDARLQRALALWKLGRLDEAAEELGRARVEDPKSARVLVTTGAVLLDKGELAKAESALLSALSMESSNHEAHFYLARVRARRLEYTQAIESMRSALEREPRRAAYHHEMGLIYRDAKRLNDAIDSWNATLKLEPQHADALEALGQAFLDRGELERAVESFDAALRSDPARTRILGLVGDCYFQDSKWDAAISRYQKALKADPKLVQIYYKLGRAYSEKGDHARSIAHYQRATVLDPDNAMPYFFLGYAYKERGRKREAVAAFRDYLRRRPDADNKDEIELEIYDLEQDYQ